MNTLLGLEALRVGISTPVGVIAFLAGLCVSGVISMLAQDRLVYLSLTVMLALPPLFAFFVAASPGSGTSQPPGVSEQFFVYLAVLFFVTPFSLGWLLGWPLGALANLANPTRTPRQ